MVSLISMKPRKKSLMMALEISANIHPKKKTKTALTISKSSKTHKTSSSQFSVSQPSKFSIQRNTPNPSCLKLTCPKFPTSMIWWVCFPCPLKVCNQQRTWWQWTSLKLTRLGQTYRMIRKIHLMISLHLRPRNRLKRNRIAKMTLMIFKQHTRTK